MRAESSYKKVKLENTTIRCVPANIESQFAREIRVACASSNSNLDKCLNTDISVKDRVLESDSKQSYFVYLLFCNVCLTKMHLLSVN